MIFKNLECHYYHPQAILYIRVMTMSQCRSINCNKRPTLVQDADCGEGCACVDTGNTWKLFTFCSVLLSLKLL